MKSLCLGAFEAKNRLSELLDRVEAGDKITIQRRGKPIAMLVPHEPDVPVLTNQQILDGFLALRTGAKPGPSAREMIQEGRR
jgi:prevent-host-death family protein